MSFSFESNYPSLVSTVKTLRSTAVQLRSAYKSIKAASEASLLEEEVAMDAAEDILDRMRSCPPDSFADLRAAHKAAKEALKVIRSTTTSLLNQADEASWKYQAALDELQEAIHNARAARVKVLLDGDVISVYVGGELLLTRTFTHQVVVPAVALLSDAVVAVSSYPLVYLLPPAQASTSSVVPTTTNKAMLSIFSFSLSTSIRALAPAFRLTSTTRRAMKAAGRKAQAEASRKANRVARASSHRLVRTSSHAQRSARRTARAAKVAVRTLRQLATTTIATYIKVAVCTPSNTHFLISAPVLREPVQGCALPSPVLKDKVKVVPLAMQRPVITAYRPTRAAIKAVSVEVEEVVPSTPILSLAAKEALRAAKVAAKALATATQAANVLAKAEAKAKAKAAKSTKVVASKPAKAAKDSKKKGKGVTSIRAGADQLVVAGPTTDDYGWEYISPEELAASIYGEEAPAPQPAPKQQVDHYLYNMVVCSFLGRSPQPAVGQAAANDTPEPSTMNNDKAMPLVPPQNVKSMFVQGLKFPLYPAKAYTSYNCPTPEGFYTLETGRVPFKSTKTAISGTHTHTFAGAEGTYLLMQNSSNGTLFVKNSHIRAITPLGGEKKEFASFLQNMLDLSVEGHNAVCAASNQEYNEIYQDMITEGGLSHEEAVEALAQQGMSYTAPIKYILIETKGVKNAQGEWEYVYDDVAIKTMEEEYIALGYQVLGINSSLLISNIAVNNFRLDGNLPCVPVAKADLRDFTVGNNPIKQWDASNVHLAVKAVTNLGEWLNEVMPTVKAISFSFNSITPVKEVTSTVQDKESTVHQYSLTTPDTHYAEFNLEEGSVPAWTINLWTTAPTAPSMASQKQTAAAVAAARPWTGGTTTGKAPTMTPGGLLAQRMSQQASANAARVSGGQRPAPIPANQAAAARSKGINPVVAIDSVPSALGDDSASGVVVVVNNINELDQLSSTAPVPPVTEVKHVLGATESDSKSISAATINRRLASLTGGTNLEDDLCQLINLRDLPMNDEICYSNMKALIDLASSLGLTIQPLPADSPDLGSYGNGVISIKHELSTNHTVQVLVHELVHAVFSRMETGMVGALCQHWLDNVGQSTNTPPAVSVEEQFAYSFMEQAHDMDTLVAFLRDAFYDVDGWDAHYTSLAEAAAKTSKKAVLGAAPIAIVTPEEVASIPTSDSPVLEALLKLTGGTHEVIVLTDMEGNLPVVYTQASPGLRVPTFNIKMGEVITLMTGAGYVLHTICAVTDKATLCIESLTKGLYELDTQGAEYICEADLGFGMGATHAPRILGAVRQALGKAKVKTISLPSMKRLAKEWSSVAGGKVSYPKCDLSLWPAALMKGTAVTAVPVGTTATVLAGGVDEITHTTVSATLAVLNDDGTINADALAAGLAELETQIAGGGIPMPIYCYSCQREAFKGLSVAVKPVEYSKDSLLPGVKVGVLTESPIESEDLNTWYHYLLDGLKGEGNGLFQVADFSQELYSKAFKALGIEEQLASYALAPLPTNWLHYGIVLVTRGKNARGVVEHHVPYEELLPKAVMDILVDRNIKVYTAERAYDKTTKTFVIKGTVANVHGIESGYGVYPLPEGNEGEGMLEMVNKEEYVYGNVIGTTKTFDQYMQKHVLDTIQYLVDTQGVGIAIRYMDALLPGLVKKVSHADGKEQYHLSVYNQQRNAAEYYMEFTPVEGKVPESWDYLSPRHCTISTGRADYKVNAITNLSGFPDTLYDGVTVALGLAITAAHGRKVTQDAFEGYLAGTTNLWARTENYGLPLTTVQGEHYSLTDTLKVIIENSGKTISSTPNMNVDSKGVALGKETKARWPYHMPCNSALDLSVMEALMKKGELVLCDKYAMERIIVGDGARAMLASIITAEDAAKLKAYNDGIGLEIVLDEVNGEHVYSVCWPTDKASKALNRPSQFHGSSQAGEWKVPLEWAPLHTDLGNGKRSAVRGFKQTFIATNDWLNQGSGAASQHPAGSVWSYGVNGSMRRTFSWSDVPATQENKDASGKHLRGLRPMLQGPDSFSGPSGKDKAGKDVPASQWFCKTFAEKFVVKAIEAAMYDHKGQPRIYLPGEEMVVLFDAMYDKATGNELVGFYPTGNTPGVPAARKVLFSNDLGMQKCIITGYRLLPLNRGQDLQVVLEYATVMDTRDHNSEWSGAKARGLGIKFIISHDGTIDYLNHTAPYNGAEVSLNDLYKQGAIHVTPEGLKGNYAFMQGFAAAHGNACMSGPYLTIDQYLMDGTPNPHYIKGDARMVSDMTDTDSYFYQWMKSITRTIRMQKTVNLNEWHYIKACNKEALIDGKLPGVTVVKQPYALQWDAEDASGEQAVDDVPTITVEYDVQVCVFDYWVQVEVAPPGACTGNQGMTAEQAANLQVMLKDTATKLWERGANTRAGVENAVKSAETHAQVVAGRHVPGIFYFNPLNETHNELMEHLLYQVSASGVRTLRKAEEFYNLLTALFGGNAPAADTSILWEGLRTGEVGSMDYINGEVVFNAPSVVRLYNLIETKYDLNGLYKHITHAKEEGYRGLGLAIVTSSEEGVNAVTYIDPTVFLQLGAFESHLVAADPKTHAPARRVTGAATGIVNDIHKTFLAWTTTEFWSRKGASSAVHGINCRLRNSMLGWIGVNSPQPTMMNAKGVLGRIARIGDYAGVAGKICTGIGPQYAPHVVTDKNGTVVGKLPVAIIHPDCLLAKGLKHNDIIGVGRTPTVSLAFCVVKFSRTYGRIGYIHMSFSVWAKGNNGDTDGDPCNRTRIGGTTKKGTWAGVTYRQAVMLNQHPLGMGGYDVVCGSDPSKHDCAEFVSFSAVWTKKVYNNSPELVPSCVQEWAAVKGVKVKGLEPLVNLMLPATLLDSAKKVSQHYRANVGTAYGWCSAYSAHVKEKHSFLEAVVTQLLVVESWCTLTVQQVMDVLIGGELYDAAGNMDAVTAKYPEVVALYNAKLNPSVGTAMDLAQMGQHIKVMLDASAWLWRGVYEGLGLSGYSPDASTYFQAFSSALRNEGKVCDMSTRDDKGKVTSIMVGRPGLDNGPDVALAEFISTYYHMPLQLAEEIFATCLLYNGYRAIERGQHVKAADDKQPTSFEAYGEMYKTTMSAWADTKADEFVNHSVMAGVFRRAGQGTTGVSINDDASEETSEEMIYTYAQKLWKANLDAGKAVFRNAMINEIVVKSVSLYTQLSAIADNGYEDYQ